MPIKFMPKDNEQDSPDYSGTTRRERIATAALQGILADVKRNGDCEAYAKDAVQFADAMIAELDK
jgi:hypothetical protein